MTMEPHCDPSRAARHNLAVRRASELKDPGFTSNTAPGAIMSDTVQGLVAELAPSHG
jgi:hypothetical protein